MDLILYISAGAAVGFAIGMTGVGGGSLMTPLLLLFGFPAPVAIGTDLLYASVTKAGGVFMHQRKGSIHWRIVFLLALGSVPISILLQGFVLEKSFQESEQYAQLLSISLGVMLIVTALVIAYKSQIQENRTHDTPFHLFLHRHVDLITFSMGIVLGICVTLSSVGAGAFGTAVLLVIYSRLQMLHIIGSDLAHAVPLTFVAGLGYWYNGFVDFYLLGGLLIGSLPAIALGTHFASRVPQKALQSILVAALFTLGVKYAFF